MDYDLLVSAGTHTQAKLSVPELGVHLSYRPGDVVAVCGKGFLHEVEDWSGGERVCMSHYMKDNVHEHLEVQCPNWPREGDYLSLVGK